MEPVKGTKYKTTWGGTDVPGVTTFSRQTNSGEIETSRLDTGKHNRYIPGSMDHTFSLEFQLLPGETDQEAAIADWEDQVVDALSFEPVTPSEGDRTWTADAFATSVSDSYERNAITMFSVDFRITGEPTVSIEPGV